MSIETRHPETAFHDHLAGHEQFELTPVQAAVSAVVETALRLPNNEFNLGGRLNPSAPLSATLEASKSVLAGSRDSETNDPLEQLTALIVAGDTIIGVSHVVNPSKPERPLRLRMHVLPVGPYANAIQPKLIEDKYLDRLGDQDTPRSSSDRISMINIGREKTAEKTGISDPVMSGLQAKVIIDKVGRMTFMDGGYVGEQRAVSTNGTQIITAKTSNPTELETLRSTLNASPDFWSTPLDTTLQ